MPQIYLLDGGLRLESTLQEYRSKYFEPLVRKGNMIFSWRIKTGAGIRIYDNLKDICMSMKTADYLRLPKRLNNLLIVDLPDGARNKYLKLEEEMAILIDNSSIKASNAGVLAGKLLQMANGAVYDENRRVSLVHDAKLEALGEVIEAANGKPVLIFYSYRQDLDRLSKHLMGKEFRMLNTSEDIEDWNSVKIPIMLVHPASAGHGLNLQFGGNVIVWFGLTWSLELYQQANARLHRQGQEEHVIVNHIIVRGTIDEDVMKVLQKKEVRQEDLLEAVKARLKRKNSWNRELW